MKIHTVDGVLGNFGDELNNWLWNRIAPELFETDDGMLFVGIGTILDENLPPARLRVVFGSGAGYGKVPTDVTEAEKWKVYGVRGKLTARALRLPAESAATDPAILLTTLDDLHAPATGRTIFIPHWKTTRYGRWAAVCEACNIKLVDPCQNSTDVVREIAGASKVIAESMHAAIIADSFRVPWVPVTLSREVSAFKWRDWGSSLNVPYAPHCIPPSSPIEALRDRVLASTSVGVIENYPDLDQQRVGVVLEAKDDDALLQDFLDGAGAVPSKSRQYSSKMMEMLLKRVSRVEGLVRSSGHSDDIWFHDACRAMTRARDAEAILSDDKSHRNALNDTRQRLERLREDYRAGVLDRHAITVLDVTTAED